MLRTLAATREAAGLAPAVGRMVLTYLGAAATTINLFTERARQRRALAGLDEHLMRDIGVSRSMVAREVRKHFWQL
jgi:uncharacterized protein YjiS (DUF1127 family)